MTPTTRIFCAALALLGAAHVRAQGASLLHAPQLSAAEQRVLDHTQRRVLDAVAPSVVHVIVRVGGAFRLQRDSSGVVVSPDGLVLTNRHLVEEVEKKDRARYTLHVRTADGRENPAELVASDGDHDLALLRVRLPDGVRLQASKLGDSRDVLGGETLLVSSRPNEEVKEAAFIGSASPAQRGFTLGAKPVQKDDLLLSDVNLRTFSDGAPVFDLAGRVVAIVNSSRAVAAVGEDATAQQINDYKNSFGFAMRIHVAQRLFGDHLGATAPLTAAERTATKSGMPAAIATARKAVVSVRRASVKVMPEPAETDPYGRFEDDTVGSGAVVDPGGIVLTNAHIAGDGEVIVTLSDGRSFPGEVLGKDTTKNVAVVKLTLPGGTRLPAMQLANSGAAILGERVAALGNRYGHTLSVKRGVLSSKQRRADVGAQHLKTTGYFQTDANINHGNTGGPLIDLKGRLLGIADIRAEVEDEAAVASHEANKKKDATIGFAVPADWIREHFGAALAKVVTDANSTLCTRPEASDADVAARQSQITKVVAAHADCFLNVFVKTARLGKAAEPQGLMAELFPQPADDKNFRLLGQGSGVIIDPSGLALSNWHVVDSAVHTDASPREGYKVFVSLHTGKKYEVEVLSTSRDDDLALLQLKLAPGETLHAIRLGDTDKVRVGDTAIAVGNPHGFANSVTAGLVAAKGRAIRIKGRVRKYEGLIQTDAAINPGNSGGALIDLNGFLIGINSAGNTREAKDGYAIPVNHVRKKFHETLLASDKLRSVYLGMQVGTAGDGSLVIESVDDHAPAALAGVRRGDVLIMAQGEKLANSLQFVQMTRDAQPFADFPVELLRGGKRTTVTIRPVSDASWTVFELAGFAVRNIAPADHHEVLRAAADAVMQAYTGDPTAKASGTLEPGLLVTHAHPDRVAAGMDLKPGDVLFGHRKKVLTIQERDEWELIQFTGVKELRDFIRAQATEKGFELELWAVRGAQVIKARVTARKPK